MDKYLASPLTTEVGIALTFRTGSALRRQMTGMDLLLLDRMLDSEPDPGGIPLMPFDWRELYEAYRPELTRRGSGGLVYRGLAVIFALENTVLSKPQAANDWGP